MQIYNIYQSGKNLYLDEKENPDNKIVVNKYDNEQQTLRLVNDGTLPPRLYWALRNPKLSNKYFILKLINNEDLIVGTDISATPGLWDMLLIGTDDDYIIEGTDIDQSRLTYVSDHFGRLFVRDNFLEELDFEEQCSPTFEVFYDDILDKIAELEKGGASYAEIRKAVEEYLIKHPLDVPVSSVNGKTGDVELTSEDVGALSKNDVDDELSLESTNPIQNRAVATKIKELEEFIPSEITVDDELSFESTNPVQNKVIAAKLKELEEATPEIDVDSELSETSTNPVENKVVAKEFTKLGGTVEITDGEPTKEGTVLTVNPEGEEINLYAAEEIDEKFKNIPTGEVSDEQITQAVEHYLEENPIEVEVPTKTSDLVNDSGFVESPTTAEVGQMLVVKAVDENGVPTEWEVSNVASGGVTQAQAQALDDMFKKCAFTGGVSTEYEAFKIAFGLTDSGEVEPDTPVEPDVPEGVTLTSISATYTGGNVAVGTSVNSLTGITVKATYSDGSTKDVTGYTLSGTIVEGNNTITVSYGGKTTTFTVTGVAESGGDDTGSEDLGAPVYTVDMNTVATVMGNTLKGSIEVNNSEIISYGNDSKLQITHDVPTLANKTIVVEFGECERQGSTHGRLLLLNNGNEGVIYRNTGYWGVYANGAWVMTENANPNIISNNTMKMYINATKDHIKVTVGEVLLIETDVTISIDNQILMFSGGNAYYNAVIKSIKMYEGEV